MRVEIDLGMMSYVSVARKGSAVLAMTLTMLLCGALAVSGQQVRHPDEDVGSSALRARPGLRPNTSLLFNGWGMTPAGEHVPTSDLALKLVVAPDKQRLVAVHGGFNRHGVTLIDIITRKETQFIVTSSKKTAPTTRCLETSAMLGASPPATVTLTSPFMAKR